MDRILLLFLAGSVCGCVIANLLSEELLQQIGSFDIQTRTVVDAEKRRLWLRLLKRRMLQLMMGGLVGMTPLSVPAFEGLWAAAGVGMALLLSVCTMYGGWLGIGIFGTILLPQWLCYLPAVLFVTVAAEEGTQRIRGGMWLFLVILVLLGSILEIFFS